MLTELGLEPVPAGPGEWHVRLPSQARRAFGLVVRRGERSVTFTAFFMRAPDRDPAGVYRGLLRRNLDLPEWRYAVDDDGDIYLTARVPADTLGPDRLDDLLGLLVTHADAAYGPVMHQGFVVPPAAGLPSGPMPNSRASV